LIVVSQTRENLNPFAFQPKVRSGGKALKFYSSVEMWLAVKERHKTDEREIGITSKVKVTRTKLTGKKGSVLLPIYTHYGIDDIGSCIDWLLKIGHWHKGGGRIAAPELTSKRLTREDLIHLVENKDLEDELTKLVGQEWRRREAKLVPNRKPRFQ
jgi:recombination protein RecA